MNGPVNAYNNAFKRRPAGAAGFFPHSAQQAVHRRPRPMRLRTAVGVVELEVVYGQDPGDGHWGCPIRECWGLSCHQQLSLALEDKLAFTVTATGSYAEAAAVADKWGVRVEDSTLHALTQRLGARAEAQTQAALKQAPQEREPQRAPTPLGVLMVDGWQVRHRGTGWGCSQSSEPRVEWHEWKTGVFYRLEQSGPNSGGRGVLTEKGVIGWQGEPAEFGRRLHWEAQRQGLGRAQRLLAVGDGASWIWKLVHDRWPEAVQLLDFYHATEHLWELAQALHPADEARVAAWVVPRRHQLRHGRQRSVLDDIATLHSPRSATAEVIRREQKYFAGHEARMNYQTLARRGWPIGSGAVESACRQRQCRFKRPGQFWTSSGLRHLGALTEARHNHHWDELWLTT